MQITIPSQKHKSMYLSMRDADQATYNIVIYLGKTVVGIDDDL